MEGKSKKYSTWYSGLKCNKQESCSFGCIDCHYYSIYEISDYGECTNIHSEYYTCEVYPYSCCTFICEFLLKQKLGKILK